MATVAGPGFCRQSAIRAEKSADVGALAVDSKGRIFFETGVSKIGQLAKVDTNG